MSMNSPIEMTSKVAHLELILERLVHLSTNPNPRTGINVRRLLI